MFSLFYRCFEFHDNPARIKKEWAGRSGAARSIALPCVARIIPVVTFLTPLAEHFSDLKDR